MSNTSSEINTYADEMFATYPEKQDDDNPCYTVDSGITISKQESNLIRKEGINSAIGISLQSN